MSPSPRPRRMRRLVERARDINRNPALVDGARRVRERAVGDEQVIDRLATARGRPSDVALRELAAIRSDAPGLLGEVGLTALGAWQRLSESQGRGRGEVDVAVLFTDLVGFSTWALQAGDDAAIALLRKVAEAVEPAIAKRGGEVVKRLGDGVMGAFGDAQSAVEAAFDGRDRVAAIVIDGYVPELRTGIHLGRPRRLGGDYFGVDVNIAARLADAAAPGEVLVSDRMLSALGDAPVLACARPFSAKGAPEDLCAYALALDAQGEPAGA